MQSRVSPRNFLAGLSPPHFDIFRAMMRPMIFAAGDRLFEEGTPAESAFFIEEGRVELVVRQPGGGESRLALAGTGELVGELALMTNGPRVCSARTLTTAQIMVVDRVDFAGMLAYFHPAALGVMRRLAMLVGDRVQRATRRILALDAIEPAPDAPLEAAPGGPAERTPAFDPRPFLPKLPFFRDFTEADIDELLALTGERYWAIPRGRVLFHDGEVPRAAYVVVRGAIERLSAGPLRRRLGVFGPGSIVGELGPLLDARRCATARAREDTVLLEISAEVMAALDADAHRLTFKFVAAVAHQLADRLVMLNRIVTRIEHERLAGAEPSPASVEVPNMVLLVAQTADRRLELVRQLDTLGFSHHAVEDPEEALGYLSTGRFGAVLLDHAGPAVEAALVDAQRAPVLVLGGSVDLLERGAECCLPEPLDPDHLLAQLNICFQRCSCLP